MFEEIVNDDNMDGRQVMAIAHMAYGQVSYKWGKIVCLTDINTGRVQM